MNLHAASRMSSRDGTLSTRPPLAHLPALDGLRAVAVMLVLWVHLPFVQGSVIAKAFWSVGQAIRAGYIGVDLFFVLSGFLITRILLDERVRTGSISLRVFYTRRALRIFAIYYLCVAVYVLAFPFDGEALLSLVTYTFNYYHPFNPTPNPLEHTWSLAVEEQFYIVWPALIAAIPLARGRRICGTLVPGLAMLVALLLAATLEATLAASLIYMSSATRMMSLSLGAALAFRELAGAPTARWRPYAELVAGTVLLAADQGARAIGLIPPGGWYWTVALLGYALVSVGTVSLLIASRDRLASMARTVLSWRPLRYVGRISYGLYLYHLLLLFLLGLAPYQVFTTGAPAAWVALAVVATFATAALSYRFIEAPLLRLKDRFGRRDAPAPTYVD
ncbi:MAG: acyltransferase [Rhodoplanes sp.]|uniref:acyltransferase family protein n=1 Tax=Rhodoplanes sp. TaxID=1968906 RepID=UPI0017F9E237|nr:acyltransferase [Rhodoplanes sp.]NVO12667.1 acyltransferase [Rhodoplanes sp.]